jgi:hypothetical protein
MRAFNLLNYVYAENFFLSKNVNFKSRFAKKKYANLRNTGRNC